MYFFDPARGRRRRARVRDKVAHVVNVSTDAVGTTARDLAHRVAGNAARVRSAMRRRTVDDVILIERVRAQLGRVVSHPHAIEVEATGGRVRLSGHVSQAEVNQLLRVVKKVQGVREVVNALKEQAESGGAPALPGGSMSHPQRPEVLQRAWSPTTRLVLGTAGVAAAGYGAARRDVPGRVLTAVGVGLVARAARTWRRAG
jgi:hypothetical protein